MLVSHSHPVIWVKEVVEAFRAGWKLKPEDNAGHPSTAFLLEIKLFKGWTQDYTVCKESNILVEEYDCLKFLQGCQEAVMNGFELIDESIRFNSVGIKRAEFINPNFIEVRHYSKKELEDMDWSDLKKTGRMYGHGGRDRTLLVNKILTSQKEN